MNPSSEAIAWYKTIVERFYRAIHVIEPNNYDHERFGSGGEHSFDVPTHRDFLTVFSINFDSFYESRKLLSDRQSIELYDQLILYKLVGHNHARLPRSNSEHWETRASAESFCIGAADEAGMFGPLKLFQFPFDGQSIKLKAWRNNVAFSFLIKQYYYERDGLSIRPAEGDVAVDMGACFGDTALAFAASVGERGIVHTFDFLPMHVKIISDNLQMNPALADRIRLHSVAVGERDSHPTSGPGLPMAIDPGARVNLDQVPVRSLDSMLNAGEIERVDFIKMDIEGSELAALKGAVNALVRFRPKLAISLYHRLEDFVTIPDFLNSLGLGYEFHLDHYTIYAEETVLFASAA